MTTGNKLQDLSHFTKESAGLCHKADANSPIPR